MDIKELIENRFPQVYRDENRDAYYDFQKMNEFLRMQSIENLKSLIYRFDLMGWLEDFRLTPTGFSAMDGTGIRNVFTNRSNKDYRFYIDTLDFEKEI